MNDPMTHEDGKENVEELKDHQTILAYTLFRAIKENKDITSLEDFCDFFFDRKTEYYELKNMHKI